jgi:O-methyltransferase
MRSLNKRLQRKLLFLTPLKRYLIPRYQYSFSPCQLSFINKCFLESHLLAGVSLEIGCYVGSTTVFLNANYRYQLKARPYYAIDTFSGFTSTDIKYEEEQRGKNLTGIDNETLFSMNSQSRFEYTMKINGFDNVKSIKLDADHIDAWGNHETIAFCLIDVDLYLPTRKSLEYVIPRMADGGTIIVDDCVDNSQFDGAFQALREMADEKRFKYQIVEDKLGLIKINNR